MWYLLLINPFLDFAFPLPGGQQVLMLDWGKHEEIYNFESAQDWMEFSQRAKNCLIPLQEWHVTQFARSSGAAKVIGIHAPPLGPSDQWSDSDLSERTKVFKRSEDSRMRKPDGTITRVENHSLCGRAQGGTNGRRGSVRIDRRASRLVHPKGGGGGVRGYNWSSQVTYRHGLLLAYPPATDREARLLRSVTHSEVSDQGRGAGRGIAAIRRAGGRVRAFPAPLYANTTSAGPRGHQYDSARTTAGGLARTWHRAGPGWSWTATGRSKRSRRIGSLGRR